MSGSLRISYHNLISTSVQVAQTLSLVSVADVRHFGADARLNFFGLAPLAAHHLLLAAVAYAVHGALFAGHVVGDEGGAAHVGTLATEQAGERLAEVCVLPRVDQGVDAGVGDGQRERDLVHGLSD